MRINYLSSISYNYREISSDSAIHYCLKTLELAEKISSNFRIARVKRFLADTYEQAALLPLARKNYEEAIDVFETLGKKDEVATTLLSLSIVLTKEFKIEQAIEILNELISLASENEDWDLETYSRMNLSGLYINQLDYQQAIIQLNKTEDIFNGLDLSNPALKEYIHQQKPQLYNNLGTSFQGVGLIDSAEYYFKTALAQSNINKGYDSTIPIENNSWEALSYFNLGYINEKKEDWSKALENYKRALDLYLKVQNKESEIASEMRMGYMHLKLRNMDRAHVLLTTALTKAKEVNSFQKLRDSHEHLTEYFTTTGNTAKALESYKLYNTYRDSILTVERVRNFQEMQTKYDADLLESENQKLEAEANLNAERIRRQQMMYGLGLVLLLGLGYAGYARSKINRQKAEAKRALVVRKAMEKFVPNEFLKSIGRNKITEVQLGDQTEQIITVLFTDIRNFTSLSEQMSPKENFDFVKEYAAIMGPVINKHHGFINQYLGDGIMALFKRRPDDALNAAIDMQKAIDELNKNKTLLDQELNVGMGMHTGPLIMGIIGHESRHDATLISDTVNSAARIESATKQFDAKILLSESSFTNLAERNKYLTRTVGKTMVKGKKQPITLIECYNINETYTSV